MRTRHAHCSSCAADVLPLPNGTCGFCGEQTNARELADLDAAGRYSVARAALCVTMAARAAGLTLEAAE